MPITALPPVRIILFAYTVSVFILIDLRYSDGDIPTARLK